MTKDLEKIKTLKICLISLVVFLSLLILSTTTLAYFNFKKVYEGEGNLPKLNLDYAVVGGSANSLRNIPYSGQTSQDITVSISSYENTIKGYVRVKVGIVWSNSLNNTPYNDYNQLVTACNVSNKDTQNANLWEYKNGYYYLKEAMEKDTEIVLFDEIIFAEGISSYLGERVSIYVFVEIYQTTNLPENW